MSVVKQKWRRKMYDVTRAADRSATKRSGGRISK